MNLKYKERKKFVIQYVKDNRTISTPEMIEQLRISRRNARHVLTKMVDDGILKRHFNLSDTRRKFYTLKKEN